MGAVVKYHHFEEAKQALKAFSEHTTTDLELKRVEDHKGIGEFFGDLFYSRGIGLSHKVTGEELNQLTAQIQKNLHRINNTQIKLIREFGQVYCALDALDKDYIRGILVSIKATEETSEGLKQAYEKIEEIVEEQRRTIDILKKFKRRLEGYAHLSDVDRLWSDCRRWESELQALSRRKAVDEKVVASVQNTEAALTVLAKRIKCVYWIAGEALVVAMIALVLWCLGLTLKVA